MKKIVALTVASSLAMGLFLSGCAMDEPAASGSSALASANPGRYYTDAVAWADSTGLLSGTGKAFVPGNLSPRADIVTYLYRDLAD